MYKLIIGGVVLGIIFFFVYRMYLGNERFSGQKNSTKIINNNIDLGLYKITSPKYVHFQIVNNNANDLKVEKIIPDCDCYSVVANKKLITPNDTLVVTAKYDAYPGPFLKKIHIYFENDKTPLLLFFKGKVITD